MSGLRNVRYEVADGIATITLARPERLNALDHGPGSMQREIVECMEAAEADRKVRCVLVTGEGRAFSSGGSMTGEGPGESIAAWLEFLETDNRENARIFELHKPVIGAINGLCLGAALIMVAHFDLLVAKDTARFGLIETRFGSSGVDMLAFLVGPQWARFLAMSGELISARKAKEIGLVLEVFGADEFDAKARDLTRRVAAMPTEGVMLNRRVINGALKAMGWSAQAHYVPAVNAIANLISLHAEMGDGRRPLELLEAEGWEAFKDARDAPFRAPWLPE